MMLWRSEGNSLYLRENQQDWNVEFPVELIDNRWSELRINEDGRYLIYSDIKQIWLYDRQEERLLQLPHKVKKNDMLGDLVMDKEHTLYYSDCGNFWRWRIGEAHPQKLYHFQHIRRGPHDLKISPDGRYLSYFKWRSDDKRLYLYDIQRGTEIDWKFSMYHYDWLDQKHLAWTKYGGIKVLNVETGERQLVLRDYKAVLKRYNGGATEPLQPFLKRESVMEDLDLLGNWEGRFWFCLRLLSVDIHMDWETRIKTEGETLLYCGIWSVDSTGMDIQFHYAPPEEDMWRGNASCLEMGQEGKLTWFDKIGSLHIYDENSHEIIQAYHPVLRIK